MANNSINTDNFNLADDSINNILDQLEITGWYANTVPQVQNTLINQIFNMAIARWEIESDLGYDEITIADITKNIIETTLKISTEYLEELHRLS